MIRREVVAYVAERMGGMKSKQEASEAVDAVLEAISEGLRRDGKVAINGFGSFKRRKRAARQGVSPRTGESITIPASTTVSFTPSPTLRERVS